MAFNENTRVKLPAILHLCRLGYKYLSLSKSNWDIETNIFTDVFKDSVKRINPDIEDSDINRLLQDVSLMLFPAPVVPPRHITMPAETEVFSRMH